MFFPITGLCLYWIFILKSYFNLGFSGFFFFSDVFLYWLFLSISSFILSEYTMCGKNTIHKLEGKKMRVYVLLINIHFVKRSLSTRPALWLCWYFNRGTSHFVNTQTIVFLRLLLISNLLKCFEK